MLPELLKFLKGASAATEADSARDGFLSYSAESHAAGMGIAAGWFAAATGETRLLSVVYGAAVYGRAQGTNETRRQLARDIVAEPHYALAGVVLGATVGSLVGGIEVAL